MRDRATAPVGIAGQTEEHVERSEVGEKTQEEGHSKDRTPSRTSFLAPGLSATHGPPRLVCSGKTKVRRSQMGRLVNPPLLH